MDLTPRLLEQYVVVAEELHFGRAAQRLSMSQPPLSQAIARLERGLGVSLLDRSNKKVRLTAAGASFARDAGRMLAAQHVAVDRARRIGLGLAGEMRIGSGSFLPYRHFPDILAAAAQRLPELRLHARQEPSAAALIEMVRDDVLDVAFIMAPIPDLAGLEITTGVIDPLFAAVPATHHLAAATSISLAELRDDNFVLPSDHVHELGQHILLACHQAGFTPRDYARADNAVGLLCYIAAGLCVSLIPHTPYPGVIFIPLRDPPPAAETTIVAVYRPDPDPAIPRLLAIFQDPNDEPSTYR